MASMRDAIKRLDVIYHACAPEAQQAKEMENQMDQFTKLRKRIHLDVKAVRQVYLNPFQFNKF